MSDRAARRPLAPIVNPAAAGGQFTENFRRIYFGGLADNRSLGGGQGIYHVRVLAPLEVTDEGVGLNMHDARMYTMLAGMINHVGGKVRVSSDDQLADYLADKLVGDDGTGDNLKVELQELNDGGDEDLKIVVTKSDVRDAANGSDLGSSELKIHYKGTNDLTETLDSNDWRGRLVRVWARAADSADIDTAPDYALAAGLRPLGPTGTGDWATLAVGVADSNVEFSVYFDTAGGDAGKLKLAITNKSGVSAEAWFHCRIDVMGSVPTSGYTNKGNWQ